jgi:hypothetical protein
MFRRIRRATVALSGAVFLAAGTVAASVSPVAAYGPANWQVTFAGTGTAPGTGFGFGFWGWCDFAGGVASGNNGDCQVAQYFHAPSGGGFTCHESLNVTSWNGSGGTFVIDAATATVNPIRLTGPCLSFFPGPGGFPVDTGFPSAAGHYNFGGIGGVVGEFQITVTQIK